MDAQMLRSALAVTLLCVTAFCTAAAQDAQDWREVLGANRLRTTATDYQCVSDCTRQGYQWAFCNSKCSYSSDTPAARIKQVDYQCLNNCTQQGYQYGYCKSRCSY